MKLQHIQCKPSQSRTSCRVMDTCATGSHRRCRPEKWEGQQMAMGPAAKSLVAISTNVAGTVLIITLEVAYRI